MLKNVTIKSRIIFVIVFLSFQLVVGGIIGMMSLGFANDTMKSFYDSRLAAVSQLDQVVRLLDVRQTAAAHAITGDPDALRRKLDAAKAQFENSQQTYYLICIAYIVGTLFGLLLAAIIGTWLVRAISAPLKMATDIAGRVAAGDLTQHIEVRSNDEIGQLTRALKNMNDRLVVTVGEVLHGTDTIAAASTRIATGNRDLSYRTAQQASSLEQTASTMEQLTATVKENSSHAGQANQLATSASSVAVQGGAVVSQLVDTMGSINASAGRIADIIGTIDGIAFQTNILALNAAVEAARAGDQGRGFAVVAVEVRQLAQRTTAAAKEIKTLIHTSVKEAEAGKTLAGQAGDTMVEVVESVRRVSAIMREISAATQEQSIGIEQVNQAIAQMDRITQQDAALVEQAAAVAENLQEQATELVNMVGMFRLRRVDAAAGRPAQKAVLPTPSGGKVLRLPLARRLKHHDPERAGRC